MVTLLLLMENNTQSKHQNTNTHTHMYLPRKLEAYRNQVEWTIRWRYVGNRKRIASENAGRTFTKGTRSVCGNTLAVLLETDLEKGLTFVCTTSLPTIYCATSITTVSIPLLTSDVLYLNQLDLEGPGTNGSLRAKTSALKTILQCDTRLAPKLWRCTWRKRLKHGSMASNLHMNEKQGFEDKDFWKEGRSHCEND